MKHYPQTKHCVTRLRISESETRPPSWHPPTQADTTQTLTLLISEQRGGILAINKINK